MPAWLIVTVKLEFTTVRIAVEAFDLFPALSKLKNRKAGFMSGGEQQMLAIGMALVVRPKLLLLDEPLLGLSPMMQQAVMDAVIHLKEN